MQHHIGGISIFDLTSRENFGLSKYPSTPCKSFYIGQWKNNLKSGKGFLKIDDNHLYFGEFLNNQFNGQGFYYNKDKNFNFGEFINGIFQNGISYIMGKNVYIGKYMNGKKNDDFCCYANLVKKTLFIGKINNDLFNEGHIASLVINDNQSDKVLEYIDDGMYYYIKNEKVHKIKNLKDDELFDTIVNIFDLIYNLNDNIYYEIIKEYEQCDKDKDYNNKIVRYKSRANNRFAFEAEFLDHFNIFFEHIKEKIEEINKTCEKIKSINHEIN